MRRISLVIGFAIGAVASAVVWVGWRWVTPNREPPPDRLPVHSQEVRLRSLDGTVLHGLWIPGRPRYPSVVLCHGYFKSLNEPLELGLKLNQAHYNVFLFDFRACGGSGGHFTTLGHRESWDVEAAVRLVAQRFERGPVGVLGISMGAAAAIIAAAHEKQIAAVVADSAFADLGGVMRKKVSDFAPASWLVPLGWLCIFIGEMMAGGGLRKIRPSEYVDEISPRPILFIHGELDGYIPADQPHDLFESAGEPKEQWIAAGSDHAVARLDHPDEYLQRVISFFDRSLRGVKPPRSRPSSG